MTKKKYWQLQPEERMRIEIWKAEQIGVRDMAF
ncbi:helix-turn-helix domain-containing protein, partial [Cupriavidus sp. AcVe19-6a]